MKKIVLSVFSALMLLTGCSASGGNATGGTGNTQEQGAAPSTLKYVIGSNDWSSLKQVSSNSDVLEAYQFAVAHPEVLKYMPCYCGCADDGHQNNDSCFVQTVKGNEVTLDNMGYGWDVCVSIAREAKKEYEKGVDLKTIRNHIDQLYSGHGTNPTPTPMPPMKS